jgi:hypothetical protein
MRCGPYAFSSVSHRACILRGGRRPLAYRIPNVQAHVDGPVLRDLRARAQLVSETS